MENNEIMNEEMDNEVSEVENNYDDSDSTDGGSTAAGVVIGLGLAGVAGLAAFVISKRDKIEQWKISRLEKKGYKVEKLPEPEKEVETDEVVEIEKVKKAK